MSIFHQIDFGKSEGPEDCAPRARFIRSPQNSREPLLIHIHTKLNTLIPNISFFHKIYYVKYYYSNCERKISTQTFSRSISHLVHIICYHFIIACLCMTIYMWICNMCTSNMWIFTLGFVVEQRLVSVQSGSQGFPTAKRGCIPPGRCLLIVI